MVTGTLMATTDIQIRLGLTPQHAENTSYSAMGKLLKIKCKFEKLKKKKKKKKKKGKKISICMYVICGLIEGNLYLT